MLVLILAIMLLLIICFADSIIAYDCEERKRANGALNGVYYTLPVDVFSVRDLSVVQEHPP